MSHLILRIPAILLSASYVGEFVQRFRFPSISGYLVCGVIAGPHISGLLSQAAVHGLQFVDQVCLSCIAFAAGSELHISELRKIIGPVSYLTSSIAVFSWCFVGSIVMILAEYIPFMKALSWQRQFAVASMAGTVSVARSPATAIAVLREVEGRGAFCSLTLSVIVMKDVLVIIMFALNLEFVRFSEMVLPSPSNLDSNKDLQVVADEEHLAASFLHMQIARAVVTPFLSVLLSLLLGAIGGALAVPLLRPHPVLSTFPASAVFGLRAACLVAISFSFFLLAGLLHAEPLLVCVTIGLYASNHTSGRTVLQLLRQRAGHGSVPLLEREKQLQADREALEAVFLAVMPSVNLVFFSLAGASLALDALAKTMHISIVIFLMRLLSLYVGVSTGCRLAHSPADHAKVAWMAYITQAGVALGLIKMIAAQNLEWGPPFCALMVGVVVCNLLTGPPLFKAAIVAVGEAHSSTRETRSSAQMPKV
ncbi:hypothetical protein CYMTET_56703 [Cymbomonas tetramitiformis]|uniref:Cation/H+ exchanger transmembrane domain-containing protein n=1 Tax=Cymbomonas tetramitiformis TaxID=36881 RepID=A0AAE0BBS8_9CHLO|nr:hypothetical protein CYMTET_56703 [Cymbomonas tetramitiformis]